MSVIALSIEPHAFDRTFAKVVTESLGLEVIDLRDFERQLAWSCGTEEVLLSAPLQPFRHYSSVGMCWTMTRKQLAARIREQILDAAAEGNVALLSWSASEILRPIRHVARVLVRAPAAHRAAIVQRKLAYTHFETASMEVASEDAAIRGFVQSMFKAAWQDLNAFDLVINSECMNEQRMFELIEILMACPRFRNQQRARSEIGLQLRNLRDEEQSASGFTSQEKSGSNVGLFGSPLVS